MKGSTYFRQLRKNVTQEEANKAIYSAAVTIVSEVGERIFQQGKATDGSDIGKYDTEKELYVNPKKAPKSFPKKGKEGTAKFKNGKPHKTGYFESYSAYRKKVGRQSNKVNLVLFGVLQSDFVKAPFIINDAVVVRVSKNNNDKIEGAENRYGKEIFSLSEKERKTYRSLVNEQLKEQILKNAK